MPEETSQADIARVDRELERLVDESRTRMTRRLDPRDRVVSVAMGGAFLAAAAAMAVAIPSDRSPTALQAILLVCTLAAFSRVQFEIGAGVALPTQLALVPMLFVLPAATVPLAAAAGYVLAGLVDCARGRLHPERLLVILGSSWHAVGPALVFVAAGEPSPSLDDWPLYAGALLAQFAFDLASTLARDSLALGVSPRLILPCLLWVYAVDAMLFPAGLMAALATGEAPYAFVLLLPLAGLLALFARERRSRLDRVLELAGAYRRANEEARRDTLTGVGNRLAWEEATAGDRRRAADAGPVSIILVDVDGLKATNDAHGHETGDVLLRELARLLKASIREGDVVCRIGGDEFAVFLPGADERECAEVVTRLRGAIGRHMGISGSRLSAAIGAASSPPAPSLVEARRRADSALYDEKSVAPVTRPA
ncbi:MAG TPA: GGDEF domain-containing protein [Gaiellaceae bacterium]|nr:GGDEF domain-containing protein [Gaiellaceae bacterium]